MQKIEEEWLSVAKFFIDRDNDYLETTYKILYIKAVGSVDSDMPMEDAMIVVFKTMVMSKLYNYILTETIATEYK